MSSHKQLFSLRMNGMSLWFCNGLLIWSFVSAGVEKLNYKDDLWSRSRFEIHIKETALSALWATANILFYPSRLMCLRRMCVCSGCYPLMLHFTNTGLFYNEVIFFPCTNRRSLSHSLPRRRPASPRILIQHASPEDDRYPFVDPQPLPLRAWLVPDNLKPLGTKHRTLFCGNPTKDQ